MQRRKARIDSLLREVLNEVLRSRVSDPRASTLWTITFVDVSPDLRKASVGLSVFGSSEEATATVVLFQKLSGFVGSIASRMVQWRIFPQLRFRLDKSLEEALRLEQLLQQAMVKNDVG